MTDPRLTTRTWKRTVRAVLERDGHVCVWCGGPATTADHVIARAHGGSDALSNLVAACLSCNSSRGARPGPPPRLRRAGAVPPPPINPRDGSTTPRPLVQTSGTTATITGPTSGVFTITRPAYHADALRFTLTATGDDTDTATIVIPPDNMSAELVFTGGDPTDIGNWD